MHIDYRLKRWEKDKKFWEISVSEGKDKEKVIIEPGVIIKGDIERLKDFWRDEITSIEGLKDFWRNEITFKVSIKEEEIKNLKTIGILIFHLCFPPRIWGFIEEKIKEKLRNRKDEDSGIYLNLYIEPDLSWIPIEYSLFYPEFISRIKYPSYYQDYYFYLSIPEAFRLNFIRRPFNLINLRKTRIVRKSIGAKILLLIISAPEITSEGYKFDAEKIEKEIEKKLGSIKINMKSVRVESEEEFETALNNNDYNILIIVSHSLNGSLGGKGFITGEEFTIRKKKIVNTIKNITQTKDIKLAILCACNSVEIAKDISQYLPAVIGVNGTIINQEVPSMVSEILENIFTLKIEDALLKLRKNLYDSYIRKQENIRPFSFALPVIYLSVEEGKLFESPEKAIVKEWLKKEKVEVERREDPVINALKNKGILDSSATLKDYYFKRSLERKVERKEKSEGEEKEKKVSPFFDKYKFLGDKFYETQWFLEEQIKDYNKKENKSLFIIGDTGIGKTVFLSYYFCKLAEEYIKDESEIIPIFISARELEEIFKKERNVLSETIKEKLKKYSFSSKPEKIIDEIISQNRFIVLIDAIDETEKPDKEYDVIYAGKIFAFLHPTNNDNIVQLILTSRKDYFSFNEENFRRLHLSPISDVKDFLGKFLEEWEIKEIFRNIKTEQYYWLQHPLFALASILYFRENKKLPNSLSEIGKQIAKFLWGWKGEKEIKSFEKKNFLCLFAFLKFAFKDKSFKEEEEIYNAIKRMINNDKYVIPSEYETFKNKKLGYYSEILEELIKNGLLKKEGEYDFYNTFFRNYFRAGYLADLWEEVKGASKERKNKILDFFHKLYWDHEWHEAIAMCAGLLEDKGEVESFIGEILSQEDSKYTHTLLYLSARCCAEAGEKGKEMAEKIFNELINLKEFKSDAQKTVSQLITILKIWREIAKTIPEKAFEYAKGKLDEVHKKWDNKLEEAWEAKDEKEAKEKATQLEQLATQFPFPISLLYLIEDKISKKFLFKYIKKLDYNRFKLMELSYWWHEKFGVYIRGYLTRFDLLYIFIWLRFYKFKNIIFFKNYMNPEEFFAKYVFCERKQYSNRLGFWLNYVSYFQHFADLYTIIDLEEIYEEIFEEILSRKKLKISDKGIITQKGVAKFEDFERFIEKLKERRSLKAVELIERTVELFLKKILKEEHKVIKDRFKYLYIPLPIESWIEYLSQFSFSDIKNTLLRFYKKYKKEKEKVKEISFWLYKYFNIKEPFYSTREKEWIDFEERKKKVREKEGRYGEIIQKTGKEIEETIIGILIYGNTNKTKKFFGVFHNKIQCLIKVIHSISPFDPNVPGGSPCSYYLGKLYNFLKEYPSTKSKLINFIKSNFNENIFKKYNILFFDWKERIKYIKTISPPEYREKRIREEKELFGKDSRIEFKEAYYKFLKILILFFLEQEGEDMGELLFELLKNKDFIIKPFVLKIIFRNFERLSNKREIIEYLVNNYERMPLYIKIEITKFLSRIEKETFDSKKWEEIFYKSFKLLNEPYLWVEDYLILRSDNLHNYIPNMLTHLALKSPEEVLNKYINFLKEPKFEKKIKKWAKKELILDFQYSQIYELEKHLKRKIL